MIQKNSLDTFCPEMYYQQTLVILLDALMAKQRCLQVSNIALLDSEAKARYY